jgi:hypothetical protein
LIFQKRRNCSSCTGKASFCFVLEICRFGIWAPKQTLPHHVYRILFTDHRQAILPVSPTCLSVRVPPRTHAHTHTHTQTHTHTMQAPPGRRTGIPPSTRPNFLCEDNVFRHTTIISCA